MDSPATIIRVKALQPQRRRAGMLFTREARDLAPGDLGEGVDAAKALLALVSDPQLAVTAIDADGGEHEVTQAMIEALQEPGPEAGAEGGAPSSEKPAAGSANPAQVTEPDPKPARPPAAKKPAGRNRTNGAGGKSAGAGD